MNVNLFFEVDVFLLTLRKLLILFVLMTKGCILLPWIQPFFTFCNKIYTVWYFTSLFYSVNLYPNAKSHANGWAV